MTFDSNSLSDNELMLRIKRGEVDLMGLLFERHGKRMYSYFARNTGSPDDAEDLLQNLFERMIRYRHTYRGEAKFTTWMYQVASNLRADYFKNKERNAGKEEAYSHEIGFDREMNPIGVTDENAIKQEILDRALPQLPDEYREVLVLGKFEGLRYREVAEILECSEGAVKIRIYRALKELKKICRNIAEDLNYEI